MASIKCKNDVIQISFNFSCYAVSYPIMNGMRIRSVTCYIADPKHYITGTTLNGSNKKSCTEEASLHCLKCKLFIDGMAQHGFQNQIGSFQQLSSEINKSSVLDKNQKDDSIEMISTVVQILGHTGAINAVILKTFDKQLREVFRKDLKILELWESLKDEINT